ncbi:MAG: (Fe-S)-binding protein, partial [Candidatus Freyarchaeota archaeon]|nr:(Fe-S)-binding protein [Candidatus Jordarchaeia archaeon]
CTLCLACVNVCPVNLPTPEVVKYLRERVKRPESIEQLVENVKLSGNIFGMGNDERYIWGIELDFPLNEKVDVKAEVGYFVGCNSAFAPSLSGIPVANVTLLERAKVNYTLISNEKCCGIPLIMAGEERSLAEIAKSNVKEYRKRGIKILVTSCPACLRAWREIYPKFVRMPFKVQHTTQFLLELIREGKIRLVKMNKRVVYQDPCELARGCNIVKEPRLLIKETGASLLEFRGRGLDAECCGGGGLLRAADPRASTQLALSKLQEARLLGAEMIVTACPACKQNLLKAGGSIPIMDAGELLLTALPSNS